MNGGGAKTIPQFIMDTNDPKTTKEYKEILLDNPRDNTRDYPRDNQRPPQQQPFLSLQVSMPPKPKPPQQQQFLPNTQIFPQMPSHIQSPPVYNPFAPTTQAFPIGTVQPPLNIVNQLVIGDQHPYQNHNTIHMIYEDVLPLKHLPNSLSTISERTLLNNYIKTTMLGGVDGKNISFRSGYKNLLDKIKPTELNPYKTGYESNVYNANPYNSLPKNVLIYRSCYPIKRNDNVANSKVCAKDSIGMNLRIYKLNKQELTDKDAQLKSNAWREEFYYEYVKNEYLAKKRCPNFVSIIGYAVCDNSEINFNEIENRKRMSNVGQVIPSIIKQSCTPCCKNTTQQPTIELTNTILTILTESPTQNIVKWASSEYLNDFTTKKQIQSGFHPEKVWYSVLFQMFAALYTLFKDGVYIYNFNLIDNVYIKELSNVTTVTSYWKYVINGIEYYVPNFGYLVMIDTKSTDVATEDELTYHKINGKFLQDADDNNLYNAHMYDVIKSCFDVNSWKRTHETTTFIPESIQNLFNTISSQLNVTEEISFEDIKKKLENVCVNNMFNYLNNRIGTYLSKPETENVVKHSNKFTIGEIVVFEESPNNYKFALITNVDEQNEQMDINENIDVIDVIDVMTISNKKPEITKTNSGNLHGYAPSQKIQQLYKPGENKLDEDDLLETYYL